MEVGDIPKKYVEEFLTKNFSDGFGGKTPKKACTDFAIAGSNILFFLNMHDVQSSAGG